jgi:three-Cys-motif partner protein
LESARTHRATLAGELNFLFVEERKDRAENLRSEVDTLQLPSHFKVEVECKTFAETISSKLDQLDDAGHQIAPTFALIDPFGFSGLPYLLVSRLLRKEKCEVLITFMVDSINRWLDHPEEDIRAHITETFGTNAAVRIVDGQGDRPSQLRDLYQAQLGKVAKFVRYFEMRDSKNRVVYYLFFASNNPLGHLKMKEAMWRVDPLGDFRFSDATDPNQEILFSSPSLAPLVDDIQVHFRKVARIRSGQVLSYVQNQTPFIKKHMDEALVELESTGRLVVADLKTDGTKRRKNSYPDDALLTFL